jgi:RNA polymerase sigma factor (sigma-70 family)
VKEMNEEMIIEYKKTGNVEIRNKIIEQNIGMVKKICSKLGYSEEVVQEGIILLSKSIDKFDIKRGFKFSTFAYNFVKCGLRDYVAKNVKYNGNLTKRESIELSKLYKEKSELESRHSFKYRRLEFQEMKGGRLKELEDKYICNSLDNITTYDEEEVKLLDMVEDKKNDEDYQMFKLDIKNVLTDKEILVIEMLERGYNFDDIAKHLNVTKRTVYNIFKPIKEKVIKYFNS